MAYFGRNSDPAIHQVLRDWAAWRKTLGAGHGWGVRGQDVDRSKGPAPVGVHSDPTYAEYAASLADGEGLYRLVDNRLREHYPIIRRVMVLRYIDRLPWVDVARQEGFTVNDVKLVHDRAAGNLHDAVVVYLIQGHDVPALQAYEGLFHVRAKRRRSAA